MSERAYRKYIEIDQQHRSSKTKLLPICLVIDQSASMKMSQFKENGKTRMDRLNEGIQQFLRELRQDDMLKDSVEISAVGFSEEYDGYGGHVQARILQNFTPLSRCNLHFKAGSGSGDTPAGVKLALDMLERKKQELGANRKYPWLVIFSDGRATPGVEWRYEGSKDKDFSDIERRLGEVQNEVKALQEKGKLTVISVLISERSDGHYQEAVEQMDGFTLNGKCVEIGSGHKQVSFKDFFQVLSRSVSAGANLFNNDFDDPTTRRQQVNYVSQEQINQYVKPRNPDVPTITQTKRVVVEKIDDSQLLQRLQNQSKTQMRVEEKPPQQKDVKQERVIIKKTVTQLSQENSSDDYANKLLSQIDDWDDL
ncbi:MAG: hypothetical protein E7353_02220 [Clostridiales bacterium]|nr:hypothetical protein [Clostridiales bacterium]